MYIVHNRECCSFTLHKLLRIHVLGIETVCGCVYVKTIACHHILYGRERAFNLRVRAASHSETKLPYDLYHFLEVRHTLFSYTRNASPLIIYRHGVHVSAKINAAWTLIWKRFVYCSISKACL